MYKLAVFFACLAFASALEVRQCPGGLPLPTDVKVDGCEVMPCEVNKGQLVGIEATGAHGEEITSLAIKWTVLWNGIEIEVPVDVPDGCDLIIAGPSCPIPPNGEVTLRHEFEVPDLLPSAMIVLTVMVENQDAEIIQCLEADVQIL